MMIHTILLSLLFVRLLATPEAPPALLVTLRDAQDAPVAGATVLVLDRTATTTLGRTVTDATGGASFATLPAGEVRVQVSGRLADGTALRQVGADARGVLVILGAPEVRLELRVEPDGTVIPDPGTMIVPDLGIPLDLPTAALAVTAAPTLPALPIPTTVPPVVVEPTGAGWPWPLLFAGGLVVAVLALIAARSLWRRRA